MKKIFKNRSFIIISCIVIIYLILISTLNYFELINSFVTSILNMILGMFICFITTYKITRKKEKKGYLWGIKIGLVIILVYFVISIILRNDITLKTFMYYLILLFTSISSGMIGINK